MMVLMGIEDGLYEIGQEEREEPRYYPAPWDSKLLLPSVTTVLGVVRNPYLMRWRGKVGNERADQITTETSQYGQAIHDFTAILDIVGGGVEVIGNLPPDMDSQIRSYVDWRDRYVGKTVEVEMTVSSRRYGYAGRLDRVWVMVGDKLPSVWDIKTGTIRPIFRAQTAAYKQAYEETTGIIIGRRGLIEVSRRKGKVGVREYSSPSDFAGFLSLLTVYNWLVSIGEA